MSTSTRIHIVVPNDTLAILDARRGLIPRSSYVRDLIRKDTGEITEVIQETGRQVIKAGLKSVKDSTAPKHRHRRDENLGETKEKGRTVRTFRCHCGHTWHE
jgi:hypothetical protein